ncbi:Glycerophosphocholine phosphodiesterase GPCPD1 [Aphelenchoides besseyi]|nr:Glycerophosphocholine phosphodiesterase GPCPD1 [Aphelenchoides besseyi]
MGGRILKLPSDLHEPTMKSSGSTVSAQPAPGYEAAQHSESTPPSTGPILVHFVVHCRSIRPTEFLFLTGSNEKLGNWEPAKAIELAQDKQNESLWRTKIELRDTETRDMLKFRYFIGCYLQSSSETSKQRLIRRWESQRSARTLLPSVENVNGECRAKHVDEFGVYGGKEMISDGWLTHKNQSEILLRLYGPALKFFKPRHAKRSYYIKVTAFDLRHKEEFTPYENSSAQKSRQLWRLSSLYITSVGTEDGIEEEDTHSPLPSLPSFTSTDLAILTHENPNFHAQDAHGELFRNGDDYFIFRTQSIAVDFLAFRVEFFAEKRRPNDKSSSSESLREIRMAPTILIDSPVHTTTSMSTPSIIPPPSVSLLPPNVVHLELERVALAYCMPTAMLDSYGQLIVPILAKSQLPIGQLTIDYLFVRAMARDPHPALSMEVSYCQHWKKRRTVEVGHRGFGNSYTKFSAVRENTIHSLNHAIKKGADFVEFDVQLTKDKIAVIFHDFHVLVSVAKRTHLSTPTDGSSGPQRKSKPNADHHEIAVKDLKLEQLQLLHVEHYKAMENEDKLKLSNTADESPELRPFPTLIDALKHVNKDAGKLF